MLDGLLINKETKKRLEAFAGRPSHALLLSGRAGAGKKYLANRLSAALLGVQPEKLALHPNFFVISKPEDKTEIPIDSARQLINKLTLKVPGAQGPINRIAVIREAELLSIEAQNALLKLLEEPPDGSLLILTSSRPQALLPTVVSRLQTISVQPATLKQSIKFFSSYEPSEVESAWRLSRGAPSLLAALLAEGTDHDMKQAVEEAKKIIAQADYQRLGSLQAAAKDRARFGLLMEALSKVLAVLQQSNVQNPAAAKKILEARKVVYSTQESLEKNANLRLLALNLALSIPL